MKIFDLINMESHPYEERQKNVFYKSPKFKARIIELKAGGSMPECEMKSHVVFYVLRGSAEITVNNEVETIKEGQCMITEPATLSLTTEKGVKIAGYQILSMEK